MKNRVININSELHDSFKSFAKTRGLSLQRAAEMALDRWMKTGWSEDIRALLNEKNGDK